EAHHHVPRLARIREEQDQGCDGQDIRARPSWKNQQKHAGQEEQQLAPASHGFFPSRPWGRNSSTRISRPKLNMLFADGTMNRPASASETPISTPPSSAPGIEPRPPTITMTKASSV